MKKRTLLALGAAGLLAAGIVATTPVLAQDDVSSEASRLGFGRHREHHREHRQEFAEWLGLTAEEMHEKVKFGQNPGSIALEQGKTQEEVRQFVESQMQERIDEMMEEWFGS